MVKKKQKIEVPKDKTKALDMALHQIEKQFGEGSIMKLGQNYKLDVPAISTGALSLDLALGVGGLPRGRVVEIFGPEASGKTTLTLSVIAQAQKAGGQAAFIDAEHAFDSTYAKIIGVDLDSLLISQPDTGEQALEIAAALVKSNAVDVIVIDSVAALTPRAEIEGEMGQSHMGLQARLMSQALRKLTAIVSKTSCSVIFINQLRMKIGVMFGNPETTPGGNALKFYSSLRQDVRRIDKITEKNDKGQDIVGNRVRVKVVKNKVAPPFRQAEFDVIYNRGISREGDILDLGIKYDILTKSGAFISYEGSPSTGSGQVKLGQGREQAKVFLSENPKITGELRKAIVEKAS